MYSEFATTRRRAARDLLVCHTNSAAVFWALLRLSVSMDDYDQFEGDSPSSRSPAVHRHRARLRLRRRAPRPLPLLALPRRARAGRTCDLQQVRSARSAGPGAGCCRRRLRIASRAKPRTIRLAGARPESSARARASRRRLRRCRVPPPPPRLPCAGAPPRGVARRRRRSSCLRRARLGGCPRVRRASRRPRVDLARRRRGAPRRPRPVSFVPSARRWCRALRRRHSHPIIRSRAPAAAVRRACRVAQPCAATRARRPSPSGRARAACEAACNGRETAARWWRPKARGMLNRC